MRPLPDGIHVRRASLADLDRVHDVVHEGVSSYTAWAPGWKPVDPTDEQLERIRANFESPEVWVLMALERDEVVGVVSIASVTLAAAEPPPPGTVYLWQFFVRPRWQGRGLAGSLHDLVLEEACRRGFTRMTLWAAEGAAQARRFYEREGWRPTGRRDPDSKFGLPIMEFEHPL